jgi:hypothetical protein
MRSKKTGARFARFSCLLPRTATVVGSASSSRVNRIAQQGCECRWRSLSYRFVLTPTAVPFLPVRMCECGFRNRILHERSRERHHHSEVGGYPFCSSSTDATRPNDDGSIGDAITSARCFTFL